MSLLGIDLTPLLKGEPQVVTGFTREVLLADESIQKGLRETLWCGPHKVETICLGPKAPGVREEWGTRPYALTKLTVVGSASGPYNSGRRLTEDIHLLYPTSCMISDGILGWLATRCHTEDSYPGYYIGCMGDPDWVRFDDWDQAAVQRFMVLIGDASPTEGKGVG